MNGALVTPRPDQHHLNIDHFNIGSMSSWCWSEGCLSYPGFDVTFVMHCTSDWPNSTVRHSNPNLASATTSNPQASHSTPWTIQRRRRKMLPRKRKHQQKRRKRRKRRSKSLWILNYRLYMVAILDFPRWPPCLQSPYQPSRHHFHIFVRFSSSYLDTYQDSLHHKSVFSWQFMVF